MNELLSSSQPAIVAGTLQACKKGGGGGGSLGEGGGGGGGDGRWS